MRLIVGLGNPGDKYRISRHNAGFLVLDKLAGTNDIGVNTSKFDSRIGKGLISNSPVLLAKPQTYMNLSGVAVGKLVRFFKINRADVIVIHDDLDLEFNDIRIKVGGGDGGHKGIRSIIDHLGDPEFIRVRFGIGKPFRKEMTEGYVLEPFSEDEMKILPHIIARVCDAVDEIVSSGAQAAMNKFNVRVANNSSKEVGA